MLKHSVPLSYDPKQWWDQDIDAYMRLKEIHKASTMPENWKSLLDYRRKVMVERYGESAMKGI